MSVESNLSGDAAVSADFTGGAGELAAAPTSPATQAASAAGVAGTDERELLALFFGPHADRYLAVYDKGVSTGKLLAVRAWSWPAFLVPIGWLLYRKLWLAAVGVPLLRWSSPAAM